ncbi:hypothetical protein DEU38_10374 [Rhodococcus sp. AG1013]|uniref:hypothetical protein n=1 Tax=Rhodococcus sp. AG1013 TaxID=2183996 RepID=UPI000E0BE435|nr:hypothetical protein [Rhodococcus sp. AG1013]RDI32343.1 hypothetical protein DEU38_10374 [Rhodococcus sp. AG1013]
MQITFELPDEHMPRAYRVACYSLGGHDPDTCADQAVHLQRFAQKMALEHVAFTERRMAEQEAVDALEPLA